MMLHVLETVYSVPFFWGALVGTLVWKLYCHAKARLLDRRDPLPGGHRHAIARMSRQWVAGLCMALTIGWVLLATARTEERTARLNQDVTRCWQETYQQIRAQVMLNAQNDGVSRKQQQLQREYDEDTSNWLKSLVSPPGDLATQSTNSPDRQAWGVKVSIEYQAKLDDLGRRFDALVQQRVALDNERAQHPLPEARCGKTL
jgi:hypothetical protein